MSDEHSPWMCHICGFTSVVGEGLVCSECYKITCNKHITTSMVLNEETQLYEIKLVCVECQFRKQL